MSSNTSARRPIPVTFAERQQREVERLEEIAAVKQAEWDRKLEQIERDGEAEAKKRQAWHDERRKEREAAERKLEADRTEHQRAEVERRIATRFPSADHATKAALRPMILAELAHEADEPRQQMAANYRSMI